MKEKNPTGAAAAAPAPKRRHSGGGRRRKRTRDGDGDGDVPEHAAHAAKSRESGGARGKPPKHGDGDVPEHAAPAPAPKKRDSGGGRRRKRTRDGDGDGDVPEQAAPTPTPKRGDSGGSKTRKGARDDKGGNGKDAPDHTSKLGDDILRVIISLLPPKAGARTQAVARRWRPLWLTSPLNLDTELLGRNDFDRFSQVRTILSQHPGPTRRFIFDPIRLHKGKRFNEEAGQLEGWFRHPALAGLEELEISFHLLQGPYGEEKLYHLPPSVFATAASLVSAKISCCQMPLEISSPLIFPRLKVLHLWRVSMSEDVFNDVLSGCPVLSSIFLHNIKEMGRLRISSPSIRSVAVCSCFSLHGDLIIDNAPCLERLFLPELLESQDTVRVIRAPKLELLGPISPLVSKFEIAEIVFEGITPSTLMNTISTVKILSLQFASPDLVAVVDVLRCFPCLEKLYFLRRTPLAMPMEENVQHSEPTGPASCLETHLQEVMMTHYEGDHQDITFVKFFLVNAKVLKKIKLRAVDKIDKHWMADQHSRLEVGSKASPDAQLDFINCYFKNLDTDDLSLPEPFICYSENAKKSWR